MQSRNPVFNRSDAFAQRGYAGANQAPPVPGQQLEDIYNAPAATGLQTGRMTIDDVVVKTGLMFAVLVTLAGLKFYLASPLLTGAHDRGLVSAYRSASSPPTRPTSDTPRLGPVISAAQSISRAWAGSSRQQCRTRPSRGSLFLYRRGRVGVTPKTPAPMIVWRYLVFSDQPRIVRAPTKPHPSPGGGIPRGCSRSSWRNA